jgi:hypothetical protein
VRLDRGWGALVQFVAWWKRGWPPSGRVHLAQAAIVVALVVVAGLGWLLTDERMAGMDEGPGTDPGSLGFYVSVWIAMMAAMMLPSAAPMVVVHSAVQRRRRELGRDGKVGGSVAFVGGYLVVWTAFGVMAYALFELLRSFDVEALSWSRAGRYVAAGVIAIAAVYQLTPLKDVQIGLGETIRENEWGRDRKYVVAFRSAGSPQQPLVEFVAADDYEQTRELVAVIRGSDGARRMYGVGDALPAVYTRSAFEPSSTTSASSTRAPGTSSSWSLARTTMRRSSTTR